MQFNLQHNIQSEAVYNHNNKYIKGTHGQHLTLNITFSKG